MYTVLAIGHINLDIYLKIKYIPNIDECVEVIESYVGIGGAATNFSTALTKFRIKPILYAFTGNDILSNTILKILENDGINVDYVQKVNNQIGMAIVLLQESGSKRMIIVGGANRELTLRYLPLYVIRNVNHIHVATRKESIFKQIQEICNIYIKNLTIH